jgi:hypothetical protein
LQGLEVFRLWQSDFFCGLLLGILFFLVFEQDLSEVWRLKAKLGVVPHLQPMSFAFGQLALGLSCLQFDAFR